MVIDSVNTPIDVGAGGKLGSNEPEKSVVDTVDGFCKVTITDEFGFWFDDWLLAPKKLQ